MATYTREQVPAAGLAPQYRTAAAGGDKTAVVEGTVVHFKNSGGAPVDVVLATPGSVDGLPIGDRTISIPNDAVGVFVPMRAVYRGSDGLAAWTYSTEVGVTFAVVGV